MSLKEDRAVFERTKKIYESVKLTFHGVDGFDVYNPSIPFLWRGKEYIFGRVERRNEWGRSWVRLFSQYAENQWELVRDSMIYQLEDPYICHIAQMLVFGGTHVRYEAGSLKTYYGYFFRGDDLHDLQYFTTGPEYMKDIRLVGLEDGKIGVFSRPRNEEIKHRFGCESQIGFTVIDHLDELSPQRIENAEYIPGIFSQAEWGGCNQAYLLGDGSIGIIGHGAYRDIDTHGVEQFVYVNLAMVFDRHSHRISEKKIIGTRTCYPVGPAKRPNLQDCAFSSGIVILPDGKADLYSGIGDTEAGKIVIDNPFAADILHL